MKAGLAVLKASLILLLFFSLAFIGILLFYRRRFAEEGLESSENYKIKSVTLALYTSATLIVIRTIFRTVQVFSPSSSLIWKSEAFFWVFDAVPMLVCTVVFNVWHPGRLLMT